MDFLRRCGKSHYPTSKWGGRAQDKVGRPESSETGVRLAHPCQGSPIGRAKACGHEVRTDEFTGFQTGLPSWR